MSDDSVEFGGYGPITPEYPVAKSKTRTRQPAAKQNKTKTATSDREAGPSKQPAIRNATGRQPKRKNQGEEEVVEQRGRISKRQKEEEVVEQSEDEIEAIEAGDEQEVREDKGRVGDAVVESSDEDEARAQIEKVVNGKPKPRTAGAGRTQTKPRRQAPSKSSKKVLEVRGSDGDEDEEVDIIHIDAPPIPPTTNAKASRMNGTGGKRVKKKAGGSTELDEILNGQGGVVTLIDKIGAPDSVNVNASAKDAEVARLKEKISRLEEENKALSKQLEEALRIRHTEPEVLLQRLQEQYEAKIRAAEEVNKALTEQLTTKQPLAGLGKSSILHLITRQDAEEERQGLEKENVGLKSRLEDALKESSAKDQVINELRNTEKQLGLELKAEIERANTLSKQASRQPQHTPRSGNSAEDPKLAEAIKLYEDLTNIIILNIRSQPSPDPKKKEEWHFSCFYTHTDESDSVAPSTQSLSFLLRSYENDSDGKITDWVQYTPTSLETLPPAFVEKLTFLNTAFQFERNQMALFLRSLYTALEDVVKDSNDDGDEMISD
ncbi:hypothetical protein Agabi119p4_2888 [Agaricus bisporus var. burnettii]|uniref:Monopolin complex subunit Csm1/Pcs1 C-terminal domain-containing protein n=1 Tax=Agaricus bisporus var. burnettii TaxID=192524 RepID=A0A8H7F617_AGABI|nr:hypothetical protein Agabi119p4_2888 [Agaricus bisporus var. burnettii]